MLCLIGVLGGGVWRRLGQRRALRMHPEVRRRAGPLLLFLHGSLSLSLSALHWQLILSQLITVQAAV